MPDFYHISTREEIEAFAREALNLTADKSEQGGILTYCDGQIAVHFGNPRRQSPPTFGMLSSATGETKKIYAQFKKRFHVSEREAVLRTLGPAFYQEYFGEKPPASK